MNKLPERLSDNSLPYSPLSPYPHRSKDYPVIDEIKKVMLDNGAIGSLMSGSGPTVFGIFDDEAKIKDAYEVMKQSNLAKQVFITKPVN